MTIMLITHITLMLISLVATTAMVIASLCNIIVPKKVQIFTLTATVVGIALGASLLVIHPIGSRCIELSAYVAVFSLAYRYTRGHSENLITSMISK